MALTPANPPTVDREPAPAAEPPKVGAGYITLLLIAEFGVYLAFVTPIGLSLSIKVAQLAPTHTADLGYVTGVGSIASLLTVALFGRLSDRTRSRLGRRRPFLIAGTLVGLVALVVLAQAPSVLVLGIGWVLAQLGWGSVIALLLASQADKLPESQRGKVSGLGGAFTQLAPVVGVLLAGRFAGNDLAVFLVPGAAGVIGMALFVCLVHEPDSRELPAPAEPLSLRALARSYVFNPRRHPDFAWNWLGKFLFMFGLTFNTTFMAFFLAARQHVSVQQVAGTVAALAGGGIIAAVLGAIGGGFLSDRLHRRKVFAFAGGVVFAIGAVLMASSGSVLAIAIGAVIGNLGLGMFSAVDQALALDLLPDRETGAGRFTGIYSFATTLAQGIAPLVAPAVLSVGAGGQNYTLLYLIAAAITLLGGLTVLLRVRSVH